jgi:tetratricopeptide (TPR) repeat protein
MARENEDDELMRTTANDSALVKDACRGATLGKHIRAWPACLLLSCLCLVTPARSQTGTPSTGPQHDRHLVLELWSSRIRAPDPSEDAETTLALNRLIQQVKSVTFSVEKPALSLAPASQPQPTPAPTPTPPAPEQATEPAQAPALAAEAQDAPRLPSRARKTLESLLQDPSQVHNCLEMAELLFLSGRPTEAGPFYQKALERTDPEEPTAGPDRAWILFQLGNCLRQTEMAQAQAAYAKLISEYPDSPWTELAKAHSRLISWHLNTQPRQLMAN